MYYQDIHPKISVNAENSEPYDVEEVNTDNHRISVELNEEWTRVNLELLNEQILALTQLLKQWFKIIQRELPQRRVLVLIALRLDHH